MNKNSRSNKLNTIKVLKGSLCEAGVLSNRLFHLMTVIYEYFSTNKNSEELSTFLTQDYDKNQCFFDMAYDLIIELAEEIDFAIISSTSISSDVINEKRGV